jgi:type IV pilus assembly protein PilN
MIRVNLLPHAGERRGAAEGSQTWLLLVMGVVVLEIVALFFFHQTKEDELNEITGQVNQLADQVQRIKDLVKNHAQVKKDLELMRAREDAITQLQTARKGPINVLLELSRVLTRGKPPSVDEAKLNELRQENPLAVYNPNWDPRRVWLTKYTEEERKVTLEGLARDAGDVYEFSQRLKLSRYFTELQLKTGLQERKGEKDRSLDLIKFAVEVKVNY